MKDTLLRIILAELFISGWVGYAIIAIYRSKRGVYWLAPGRSNFLHLVLSPVVGLLAIYWVAVLTIPAPQVKMPILAAMLAFSTWKNVKWAVKQRASVSSSAVVFIYWGSLLFFVVLNGQDLRGISAHDYFPRTNGDTFSYLSHVDHFRSRPLTFDMQIYPAAYVGFYQPLERNAASALASFFADGLSLDSHVAFFSILRLLLICIILGFIAILLLINLAPWIIASCVLIYAFGCFYLHSVLQQFLSATSGILASMGAVIFACLWIQSGYRRLEAVIAGGCLGLLLIYSPESFPHLFVASTCFFLLLTLADRPAKERLTNLPRTLLDVCGGMCATSLPLIFDPTWVLWQRLTTLQNYQDPPYKAQEYFSFGLHLVGLRSGLGWAGISSLEQFLLYFLIVVIFIGPIFLVARTLRQTFASSPSLDGRTRIVDYISVLAGIWVIFQVFFAVQRLSAPWIKTIDYFNFLPCLILALGAEWLAGERNGLRKFLTIAGFLVFTIMFIVAALPAKRQIFSFYRANILESPSLNLFLFASPDDGSVTGIEPAVRGFSLDLFYYMNRWQQIPLTVYSATQVGSWGSYRYIQVSRFVPAPSHRFCLTKKWNTPEMQRGCDDLSEPALVPVTGRGSKSAPRKDAR